MNTPRVLVIPRPSSLGRATVLAIALGSFVAQTTACGGSEPDASDDDLVHTDRLGDRDAEAANAPRGSDAAPDVDEPDASAPTHGLRADWFDDFSEKKLTTFVKSVTIAHDATTPPTPSPATAIRGILYSVRFTAELTIDQDGEHTFFTKADDGVRVFVDDKAVIDDWVSHQATDASGTITLTKGVHALRVEYFQRRGGAALSLDWQPPGSARSAMDVNALAPLLAPPKNSKGVVLEGPRPSFSNPVVPFSCPDPGVLAVGDEHPRFVMTCTGGKLPVRVSDDLVTWTSSTGTILPAGKASWSANGGRNWAPEIHRVGTTYVAYYTAPNASNTLSIGCASAPAPEGPFTDCGHPLVQNALGVIDATFFEDTDGKRYLYYKIDGNSVGQHTPIYVRELAASGLAFAAGSSPVMVLNNDPSTWEGGVVEAPWVVKHGAEYFMFYSGNVYDERYRTGVARASSPTAMFTKKGAPILGNNARWVGPGHGSVVSVHGRDYYFHHAWPALPNGTNDTSKGRYGLLEEIAWGADGWPVLGNATSAVAPKLWP